MMSDDEAERIRRDVEDGVRGPVLLKYVRLLLADRDERNAREPPPPTRPAKLPPR